MSRCPMSRPERAAAADASVIARLHAAWKKAAQTAALTPASGDQNVRANGGAASQNWLMRSLSPMAVFIPKKIMRPDGSYGKDWSMTLLGIALFLFLLATVSIAKNQPSETPTHAPFSGYIPDQIPLR